MSYKAEQARRVLDELLQRERGVQTFDAEAARITQEQIRKLELVRGALRQANDRERMLQKALDQVTRAGTVTEATRIAVVALAATTSEPEPA